MQRARQTPHGARPNREEVRALGRGHVPARWVKPPGRSLEPRSDARPRGMTVQQEQSRGQNSAYRSGCHKFLFSITYRTPDPGVTQLTGVGRKRRLRWLKGRLVHEIGKRGQPRSPYRCNFRERSTETLDPPQWKEPCYLRVCASPLRARFNSREGHDLYTRGYQETLLTPRQPFKAVGIVRSVRG